MGIGKQGNKCMVGGAINRSINHIMATKYLRQRRHKICRRVWKILISTMLFLFKTSKNIMICFGLVYIGFFFV